MPKQKFYVVWRGRKPGVYDNWDDCKQQVEGFGEAAYKLTPRSKMPRKPFGAARKKRNLHRRSPGKTIKRVARPCLPPRRALTTKTPLP